MNERVEGKKQHRLRRSSKQLLLAKSQMETHPLLEGKLQILATALEHLHLQSMWTSAGKGARFLLSCQTALFGDSKEESEAGVLGPIVCRGRALLTQLMQQALKTEGSEQVPFFTAVIGIMALGSLYLETRLELELGSALRRETEKKEKGFVKELMFSFLLTSQLPKKIFSAMSQGLELDENSQKSVADVALFGLLLFLLFTERELPLQVGLFALVAKSGLPLFHSVRAASVRAEFDPAILAVIELLKRSFEEEDLEAFEEAKNTIFELAGLSLQEWQQEVKELYSFSYELVKSFGNVFYQAGLQPTNIMQTA